MQYKTVKTVNGKNIYKIEGTHGIYYVDVTNGNGWKAYRTFRTIKAAAEFISRTY